LARELNAGKCIWFILCSLGGIGKRGIGVWRGKKKGNIWIDSKLWNWKVGKIINKLRENMNKI